MKIYKSHFKERVTFLEAVIIQSKQSTLNKIISFTWDSILKY